MNVYIQHEQLDQMLIHRSTDFDTAFFFFFSPLNILVTLRSSNILPNIVNYKFTLNNLGRVMIIDGKKKILLHINL